MIAKLNPSTIRLANGGEKGRTTSLRTGKVSSQAVKKATGKGWDEWIKIIDKEGGNKLSHKEIAKKVVAVLRQDFDDESFDTDVLRTEVLSRIAQDHSAGRRPRASVEWWAQTVTVGYEYSKNRRIVG